MKRILADVDRCSGCRLCEVACSFTHEEEFGPSTSRITVLKEDGFGFDLPVLCWHCNRCNSMENCPAKALKRNAEGLICLDEEKCTGCGKCVEACRLGAIKLHPERHTPLICDQCGGRPLCVEKCPTKALTYTETRMSQPKSSNRVLEEALRRWRMRV
jgi:carbon-monoxide dehydrogenase iron sulfur subunit